MAAGLCQSWLCWEVKFWVSLAISPPGDWGRDTTLVALLPLVTQEAQKCSLFTLPCPRGGSRSVPGPFWLLAALAAPPELGSSPELAPGVR